MRSICPQLLLSYHEGCQSDATENKIQQILLHKHIDSFENDSKRVPKKSMNRCVCRCVCGAEFVAFFWHPLAIIFKFCSKNSTSIHFGALVLQQRVRMAFEFCSKNRAILDVTAAILMRFFEIRANLDLTAILTLFLKKRAT